MLPDVARLVGGVGKGAGFGGTTAVLLDDVEGWRTWLGDVGAAGVVGSVEVVVVGCMLLLLVACSSVLMLLCVAAVDAAGTGCRGSGFRLGAGWVANGASVADVALAAGLLLLLGVCCLGSLASVVVAAVGAAAPRGAARCRRFAGVCAASSVARGCALACAAERRAAANWLFVGACWSSVTVKEDDDDEDGAGGGGSLARDDDDADDAGNEGGSDCGAAGAAVSVEDAGKR